MKELKKEDQELLEAVFNRTSGPLKICVGSWKAYNECNDHALGTCYKGNFYMDFTMISDIEEFYHILDLLGWSKEEQEELFIQDYESDCGISFDNCDNEYPPRILEAIVDNDIDLDKDGEKIAAIMDGLSMNFYEAIEQLDKYDFYEGKTGAEWEEEIFWDSMPSDQKRVLDSLGGYISIDFEQMAKDDYAITETDNGLLVEC